MYRSSNHRAIGCTALDPLDGITVVVLGIAALTAADFIFCRSIWRDLQSLFEQTKAMASGRGSIA